MNGYGIRPARPEDIPFLVTTVIEAERSGTERLALSTLFGIPAGEVQRRLIRIFEEEVEGCEFSVSDFRVADLDDRPVAALCGWIEAFQGGMASSILKSNLLLYHFGREAAMRANELKSVVSDCIFEREPDTLQVEYLYVSEEHRGKGLPRRLYSYIEQEAGEVLRRPWKAQVQCYPDRLGVWTNLGFSFHARRSSAHPDAQRYLPDREKIQMEQHYK